MDQSLAIFGVMMLKEGFASRASKLLERLSSGELAPGSDEAEEELMRRW